LARRVEAKRLDQRQDQHRVAQWKGQK